MRNPVDWVKGRGIVKSDELEIGRILHFKLEIRNLKLDCTSRAFEVQSEISDF
jgi:hypothetical protein